MNLQITQVYEVPTKLLQYVRGRPLDTWGGLFFLRKKSMFCIKLEKNGFVQQTAVKK